MADRTPIHKILTKEVPMTRFNLLPGEKNVALDGLNVGNEQKRNPVTQQVGFKPNQL